MKIDCLCITTSHRKKFKNWVLWNYLKQTHYRKNLVVISDDDDWPDWVDFTYADIDEPIPVKRNMALSVATGEAITWFDDDDWQNPKKLQIINDHVDLMTNVACSHSFFYDIFTGKTCEVDLGILPIFNSMGISRHGLPAFNERITRGSDTDWISKLSYRGNFITETTLFFWITHNGNFTNPRNKIKADSKMSYYLGADDWQQLRKLEANLSLD